MEVRKLLSLFLVVLFCLSIFVVVGCDEPATPSPADDEVVDRRLSDKIIVGHFGQPPTLDLNRTASTISRDVAAQMYESLFAVNADFEVVPMLAEGWDSSEDGKTVTINLRQGVKFHNGKEMTAEDVIATMDYWSQYNVSFQRSLGDGSYEASGDYQVVIKLKAPSFDLFYTMSDPRAYITTKEIAETADAVTGVKEHIGTGPFKFVEWVQDQYIHYEKFEDYQPVDFPASGIGGRKEALVNDLYFYFVLEGPTRLAGLQTNEYDIITRVPYESLGIVGNDPRLGTFYVTTTTPNLVYNKNKGLMTDIKMRQAVNAALDIDAILLGAYGDPSVYTVHPGFMWKEQGGWYTEAGIENFNQKDIEKAKRLLEEAGYNGEEVKLLTSRTVQWFYDACLVIQDQLSQIGMPVSLEIYDWATMATIMADPDEWDLMIMGSSLNLSPTANTMLRHGSPWSGWLDDPEIIDGFSKISRALSTEEAQEIWEKVHARLWVYLPYTVFGQNQNVDAFHKDKIEGYSHMFHPILWNVRAYE